MKDILLKIITLLHIFFVIFVTITPFINSNYLLFIHFIFIPFLILHWVCNDNTCVLTIVERKLRKEIYNDTDDEDCITCKLIEPVYDFRKNYEKFSTLIYCLTIGLWLISFGKLYHKYNNGTISGFRDLFII